MPSLAKGSKICQMAWGLNWKEQMHGIWCKNYQITIRSVKPSTSGITCMDVGVTM